DGDRETSNASGAKPVSSRRSSKFDFRKSLSKLFKGDLKVKETAPSSAVASAPVAIVRPGQNVQSTAPDSNAVPISLGSHSPAHASQAPSTTLDIPVTQLQPSPAASEPFRLDIFPENVAKPTYKTDLPESHARVDKTPQLIYCYSLLSKDQESPSSASDSDGFQNLPLDDKQREWVQLIDPCASAGYLVSDDLIRIATVLFKELSVTHIGTSEHALHLTLSLARVLDVMVAGKVKDLNRDRDHQPMMRLLYDLKDSEDVVQRYEAVYAYQAL
ncbi:hypothetical protein BGZ96_005789, partial [Linnemannia gamsii]